MALRYFIKYFDVVSIEHRFNIYDDAFVGTATQIDGNVTLDYSETDDPLEAIRGQGLKVELEADETLTFNDLWSEEEKTFQVEYKRDNIILFQGWLNPEGFFEDFVNTNWIVSFDCVDGLGFLENLSFVEDSTGLPITGRKTYLEVLSIALLRTGLALKINTSIDIRYTDLDVLLDPLANVYANTERYVKDDGETIMSCEEVIRDILEPFGAVLTSFNGEWYIYKPNQLYVNQTATFYNYTYLGVPSITPTKVLDTSLLIGSNSFGITPHHCSGNQKISNKSSVGAYRINYKYGLVQSLINNVYLYSVDGVTLSNFDVISFTNLSLFTDGYGALFTNASLGASVENLRTQSIQITDDSLADVFFKVDVSNVATFRYQVYMSNLSDITNPAAQIYYLTKKVDVSDPFDPKVFYAWGNQGVPYTIEVGTVQGINEIGITTAIKPVAIAGNGYLFTSVYTPEKVIVSGTSLLSEVRISPSTDEEALEGEFHTFQRTDKPSSKVEDTKEVATGDNAADFYEGTIYKADAITPTTTWNREGFVETKPLLQIMGEETLRMSQLPARIFSGDVFGYFNYLSTVTINGLSGLFMPIKYSYNTKANIITTELRQIYGDELIDINYTKTFDYGNTVKPTIKG